MPEGPEIRRAADRVEAALKSRRLVSVRFGLAHLKSLETVITGCRVTRVDTRGKALLIRLDNRLTLYTHNQLYGRWFTGDADLRPTTRRQLRVALITDTTAALLYSASTIELLDPEALEVHPFLSKLGPDPLHPTTDHSALRQRLLLAAFRNRQLGQLLTDQRFVAGLGNYLRCEILFVSGLHPAMRPVDCTLPQLDRVAETMLSLPRRSYQSGGITNEPAVVQCLMAAGATFEQARFHLFRRDGEPCYQCGNPISKIRHAGQSCYLCSRCQPASPGHTLST